MAQEAPAEEEAAAAAEGVPERELQVPEAREARAVLEEPAAASYILKPPHFLTVEQYGRMDHLVPRAVMVQMAPTALMFLVQLMHQAAVAAVVAVPAAAAARVVRFTSKPYP